MTETISPQWVQAGELGLAFVVIILSTWLVLYVMKTSAAREKMLMNIINSQTESFQKVAGALDDVVERLEAIEEKVPVRRKRKALK